MESSQEEAGMSLSRVISLCRTKAMEGKDPIDCKQCKKRGRGERRGFSPVTFPTPSGVTSFRVLSVALTQCLRGFSGQFLPKN